MGEIMLYLFTSNARPRYIQDIPNVLALPHGALYHFRYDDRIVVDELKDQNSHRRLEGTKALIVYVQQTKNPSITTEVSYYPLREATIRNIALDGIVLTVTFELGNYVDWTKLALLHPNEREQTITQVLQAERRPPKKYISIADGATQSYLSFESSGQTTRVWQLIVTAISKLPEFADTVFYRLDGIREFIEHLGSKLKRAFRRSKLATYEHRDTQLVEILRGHAGYILRSGRTYFLELDFYQAKEPEAPVLGSRIAAVVDKAYFAYAPKPIEVTFRYEHCILPLAIPPLNGDILTPLDIDLLDDEELDPPLATAISIPIAPQVGLLLKLTYPRLYLYVAFAILFMAQVITAISGQLSEFNKLFYATPPVWEDTAELLLALIGSAITAMVLFILYKRLPAIAQ